MRRKDGRREHHTAGFHKTWAFPHHPSRTGCISQCCLCSAPLALSRGRAVIGWRGCWSTGKELLAAAVMSGAVPEAGAGWSWLQEVTGRSCSCVQRAPVTKVSPKLRASRDPLLRAWGALKVNMKWFDPNRSEAVSVGRKEI